MKRTFTIFGAPTSFCSGFIALVLFTGVQSFPSSVHAKNKPELKRNDAQRTLQDKKQDLESTRRREKKLRKDVVFLKKERARLNEKLVNTAELVKQTETRLTEFEERLGELNEQEKLVRGSLARQHGTLIQLLAAMQRMGRNPPPVVVTRRKDALAMVRSAMMLASVFPELRGKALALGKKLNELVRIMTATRAQRDNLRAETTRLADTRLKLKTLVAEKQNTLTIRQSELVEIRRTARELSRTVTDLNVLIAKLDEAVARNSKLGEYQRELARLKPMIEPELPAASAGGPDIVSRDAKPSSDPAKPAVELKPSSRKVAMLSPGRMKPRIRFGRAKRSLVRPASGRQILGFGDETRFGTKSKGLAIATRPSAQITTPSDGWVVFAGPFRSYGQLLIINGGGGYHVLLAGLSQIDVSLGQFVIKGEPVGVMGKATKSPEPDSGQGTNPVLYVEFRKNGHPINPNPWWARQTKKVQG